MDIHDQQTKLTLMSSLNECRFRNCCSLEKRFRWDIVVRDSVWWFSFGENRLKLSKIRFVRMSTILLILEQKKSQLVIEINCTLTISRIKSNKRKIKRWRAVKTRKISGISRASWQRRNTRRINLSKLSNWTPVGSSFFHVGFMRTHWTHWRL